MTPKNGGKVELKFGATTSSGAEYGAFLQTAEHTFRCQVVVETQQVRFGDWQTDAEVAPPDWLVADARAALKTALRTSQAEGRWPRRITRWRPEP